MDISIFLARFWGIFLALETLIYLFRWQVISKRLTQHSFVELDGYLTFTTGIATIAIHNIWVLDWRLAVTLWGWAMLLRGISRLGFPDAVIALIPKLTGNLLLVRISLAGALIFALWLIWVSG